MGDRAAAALDALGDPTRRRILKLLSDGPRSVQEIADDVPVSRPAVSHHLQVLKAAELVATEARGTRRYYRIGDVGLEHLGEFFNEIWGDALARFSLVAQNTTRRSKKPAKKRRRG